VKLVNRNKQKMSAIYKRAKKDTEVSCKPEYHRGYGNITNTLIRLFWSDGAWCAVIYNSVYGHTYTYYS
jgi:hypothetical protein